MIQRLCELIVARRNEQWMKKRGAQEFGQAHYRFIVIIHAMFFVVYFLEVTAWEKEIITGLAASLKPICCDPVGSDMGTHFARKVLEYENNCSTWGAYCTKRTIPFY